MTVSLLENENCHQGIEQHADDRNETLLNRPFLRASQCEDARHGNTGPHPPARRIRREPGIMNSRQAGNGHGNTASDHPRLGVEVPADESCTSTDRGQGLDETPVPLTTAHDEGSGNQDSADRKPDRKPRTLFAGVDRSADQNNVQNCPHNPCGNILGHMVHGEENRKRHNRGTGHCPARVLESFLYNLSHRKSPFLPIVGNPVDLSKRGT